MGVVRRIIRWDFERASWQWDIMCLAIIAFIFLTPKAWFEKGDRLATQPERMIVQASGLAPERDMIETKVRELTGKPDSKVIGFTEKRDEAGQRYYEVIVR